MALNIVIDERYKLTSDEDNVIISRRTKTQPEHLKKIFRPDAPDEVRYKAVSYYPDITSAVKGLLKDKVKQSNATSLKELLEEINNFEKHIESLVQGR